MVYRKALRRMGSGVDLAVTPGPLGPGLARGPAAAAPAEALEAILGRAADLGQRLVDFWMPLRVDNFVGCYSAVGAARLVE